MDSNDFVYASLATVPMGWSWGLHFCHSALANFLVHALVMTGLTPLQACAQIVTDGAPAPVLSPSTPVCAPYVDNGNLLCWDDERVPDRSHMQWKLFFQKLKLVYRIETKCVQSWNIIGVTLDAERRLLNECGNYEMRFFSL